MSRSVMSWLDELGTKEMSLSCHPFLQYTLAEKEQENTINIPTWKEKE